MISKSKFAPYEIQPSRANVVSLAQVTDSHIFGETDGCLLGLNTRRSFEAVCARVNAEEWRPDVLLATGDLSQDGSAESYQYLADYFKTVNIPTFWLPGNHDNSDLMQLYLNNSRVFVDKQLHIGHWQILMLNSAIKGKVYGELDKAQLAFVEKALQDFPEKFTLICLHHQPMSVGSDWLDQIGLKNAEEFKQLVKKFSQIKGVMWGHVHQEFQLEIDNVQWIATPSSCVQFEPGSEDFCAGTEAPGYRYVNLYADGRIESFVHRIDNIEFIVDYTIKGY